MAKIWEISSGRPMASLSSLTSWFLACAISPNLERVAAVVGDGTVRLWDLRSQQQVATLRGAWGYDLAFTPDGNALVNVTGSAIVVWHAPPFAEFTEVNASRRAAQQIRSLETMTIPQANASTPRDASTKTCPQDWTFAPHKATLLQNNTTPRKERCI
jgi:WD40 repeat protein